MVDKTNYPALSREIATPDEIKAGTGKNIITPEKKALAKSTFEVPNMLVWENRGDLLPAGLGDQEYYKAGNRLYMIGTSTSILSCPLDEPENWSISGTFPYNADGIHVAVVGDTIFTYGGLNNMTAIYSAPVSDPTNFTNTGATIPSSGRRRGNLFIAGDYLYILAGYQAGITGNFLRAPLSDPKTLTLFTPGLPSPRERAGLVIVGDEILFFGGVSASSEDEVYSSQLAEYLAGPVGASRWMLDNPRMVEVKRDFGYGLAGGKIWIVGGTETSGNDQIIYRANMAAKREWEKAGSGGYLLPNGETRTKLVFMPDNHAYLFGGSAQSTRIYRTSHKQIAYRLFPEDTSYRSELGMFADGTPTMLTSHQKYGVEPWIDTNSGLYGND